MKTDPVRSTFGGEPLCVSAADRAGRAAIYHQMHEIPYDRAAWCIGNDRILSSSTWESDQVRSPGGC
jgi:hypothetical protein